MPATDTTTTVLSVLLSGGAAVMVTTLVNGVRQIRRGHRTAVRENMADLARWRDDLDERLRLAVSDVDYWRDVAGRRGWQLVQAGIEPHDPQPTPPSDAARHKEG